MPQLFAGGGFHRQPDPGLAGSNMKKAAAPLVQHFDFNSLSWQAQVAQAFFDRFIDRWSDYF
jgi:hypothetical protein